MNTKLMRRIKRLQKLTGTGTFSSRMTRDVTHFVIDAGRRPAGEAEEKWKVTKIEVTTDPATGYELTTVFVDCRYADKE